MGGKRPPIGCAEWSHARFGPGLYLVFRPFGLGRLYVGHLGCLGAKRQYLGTKSTSKAPVLSATDMKMCI